MKKTVWNIVSMATCTRLFFQRMPHTNTVVFCKVTVNLSQDFVLYTSLQANLLVWFSDRTKKKKKANVEKISWCCLKYVYFLFVLFHSLKATFLQLFQIKWMLNFKFFDPAIQLKRSLHFVKENSSIMQSFASILERKHLGNCKGFQTRTEIHLLDTISPFYLCILFVSFMIEMLQRAAEQNLTEDKE